ncbi:helix-turn-helix domain-containing protein [Corynebacterium lowii]|uniref:helix-turn-helix domain-containing protein n=1 Tax=Corynebacterium lowii TaxID=1544413 RepID=UPI003521FC01
MDEINSFIFDDCGWVSPAEVGRMVPGGVSGQAVRGWCHAGRVPGAWQTPGGRWRIPVSAVEAIIAGEVAA